MYHRIDKGGWVRPPNYPETWQKNWYVEVWQREYRRRYPRINSIKLGRSERKFTAPYKTPYYFPKSCYPYCMHVYGRNTWPTSERRARAWANVHRDLRPVGT